MLQTADGCRRFILNRTFVNHDMKYYKIVLHVALFACWFGIMRANDEGASLNAYFDLSKKSEKHLIIKGSHGDAQAAFKLYLYYELVRLDHIEALFWLRTAAGLGHATAENALGRYYADQRPINYSNLPSAKIWLNKAIRDGAPEAKKDLKELEASSNGESNTK